MRKTLMKLKKLTKELEDHHIIESGECLFSRLELYLEEYKKVNIDKLNIILNKFMNDLSKFGIDGRIENLLNGDNKK